MLHAISPGRPAGSVLDTATNTGSLTVTATTEGASQTLITGNPLFFNGSERVRIEIDCNYIAASGGTLVLSLFDNGTSAGWFGQWATQAAGSGRGALYITPTAGMHTFTIRAWKTGGTCSINDGGGGANAAVPAIYSVISAPSA